MNVYVVEVWERYTGNTRTLTIAASLEVAMSFVGGIISSRKQTVGSWKQTEDTWIAEIAWMPDGLNLAAYTITRWSVMEAA